MKKSPATIKNKFNYDRRDSRILMKKGQRMLSGACTLGIDC